MALKFTSDEVIETVPDGTPALPPAMTLLASDAFTGAAGDISGRGFDQGLGGGFPRMWEGRGYIVSDGGAQPSPDAVGSRVASFTPGVDSWAVEYTHGGFQAGSRMSIRVGIRSLTVADNRIRVQVEAGSIGLYEAPTAGGAEITHVSVPHLLSVGDAVAVGVRSGTSTEVAVWVNWLEVIPWTPMSRDHTTARCMFAPGLTVPGPIIDDVKLYEI